MRNAALLLIFLCTLLGNKVRAEEEVEDEAEVVVSEEPGNEAYEEEEYEDDVSADVITSYLLPKFADKRLPLGEPNVLLVNFINNGQEVLNITSVSAYLHSPFDLSYYIQNFTSRSPSNALVGPSSQITLNYDFKPDVNLEPLEYWMSGVVEYAAEGSDTIYRTVFFNETVELFSTGSSIDFGMLFSTTLLVVGSLVGIHTLINSTKKGEKIKKKVVKKTEISAEDKEKAASSWEIKAYEPSAKARSRGRK